MSKLVELLLQSKNEKRDMMVLHENEGYSYVIKYHEEVDESSLYNPRNVVGGVKLVPCSICTMFLDDNSFRELQDQAVPTSIVKEYKGKDFSVREEVRVFIEEDNIQPGGLSIDEVMDVVENDEVMLDAIKTAIYRSAISIYKEKGLDIQVDKIEEEYRIQMGYFYQAVQNIK